MAVASHTRATGPTSGTTDRPSETPLIPVPLWLLVISTALGPLALNIFIPSMPGIQAAFGATKAEVALTLTLYLLGLGIGQIGIGVLADRFGRRPVLIAGIVLYTLSSIAAVFAPTIWHLIVLRALQALGGCVGLVLGRAIVRDIYERDVAASMIGYVTMAMVVAPMVAPGIGGLLDLHFGWKAGFLLCGAAGALFLPFVIRMLPETRPDGSGDGGFARVLRDGRELAGSRAFWGYTLAVAFGSAMFFSFLAGTPTAVIDMMGRSPFEYGVYFAVGAIGYMSGNYTSGRLSRRIGIDRMIRVGVLLGVTGAILMAVLAQFQIMHPLALFMPMLVVAYSNGLTVPNTLAGVVSVNPKAAGSASGIAGALQMGLGAVATQIVGMVMTGDTYWPMTLVILVFAILSAASFTLLCPKRS